MHATLSQRPCDCPIQGVALGTHGVWLRCVQPLHGAHGPQHGRQGRWAPGATPVAAPAPPRAPVRPPRRLGVLADQFPAPSAPWPRGSASSGCRQPACRRHGWGSYDSLCARRVIRLPNWPLGVGTAQRSGSPGKRLHASRRPAKGRPPPVLISTAVSADDGGDVTAINAHVPQLYIRRVIQRARRRHLTPTHGPIGITTAHDTTEG
jgi:hypothetical protein